MTGTPEVVGDETHGRSSRHRRVPVIVVGTGFGGAVAACRLAQAGYDVLVLERGRRYERHDFPAMPAAPALLPDLARWTWEPNQGIWDILDLEELVSVQAAGYGGGSLLYANVQLRPPDEIFDGAWPAVYRRPEELTPYFDLAAYMMQAAPITEHRHIYPKLVKAKQLALVMDELGREKEFFHPPIAVNTGQREEPNVHGVTQRPCTGCGKCCTGCPEGAKNTLDYNYLAIAERFGARVRTQCEVLDVRYGPNGGFTLQLADHLHGKREELETPYLFLCAGSVHTTRLLLRSESVPERPESLVGTGYFPGGDALGVVYDTKNPQYPSFGPTITTTAVHWRSVSPSSFFQLQDGGYAAELARLIGTLRAPLWLGRNRLLGKGDRPLRDRDAIRLIAASDVAPDPLPTAPSHSRLPSPLDALIAANHAHDFQSIVPERLRQGFLPFLKELEVPLLFPAVVGRTIEESIESFDDRLFRRLERLERFRVRPFAKDGKLRTWLRKTGRGFVAWAFGKDDVIALRSTRALFTQGGLDAASVARDWLGYDDDAADNRVMLLGMGRDAARGQLIYDTARDRVVADLDLFHLAPGYADEELFMTDIARALGGELRTNPAWAFLGKPVTVHNQGGCPMADSPELGVLDPNGEVYGKPGLYVLDGSALCRSVGVNPSATILALAERNIERFIATHPPLEPSPEGRAAYQKERKKSVEWAKRAREAGWTRTPPKPEDATRIAPPFRSKPLGLHFTETMQGYYEPDVPNAGRHDAVYREHETRGRPSHPMRMNLSMTVKNLAAFYEDPDHRMDVGGTIALRFPGAPAEAEYEEHPVEGMFELFTPRYKPYGITGKEPQRMRAQRRRAGGYGTVADPPARERFMTYRFALTDMPGYYLWGYKRVRENPALDAWRDTSSLFVTLLAPPSHGGKGLSVARGAGVVHVDLPGFLRHQVPSFTAGYAGAGNDGEFVPAEDDAMITWAIAKFAAFFFGSLQRIYAPDVTSLLASAFRSHTNNVRYEPPRLGK
ncbi:MAG TPA: GMC oxidoreductase [Polyangiaceae bacterium]|jgi:choline dehydrogenase-like flavoprotein|nr:GMC oxidoreductase [Polyangiaceae bacterium]